MGTNEVLFEVRGGLGLITLNRPEAVNALTAGMARAMLEMLNDWSTDEKIIQVLVRGSGTRGLCAGGDIVAIYADLANGGGKTADFWATEYRLNALIHGYPKPYIAFMDGLVLGGGIGISAHGSHRIVTERTRSGMPETTIGFVPDVGGTHLLSRSPGHTGTHAALTGAHLGGAEALYLGLADFHVASARLEELARLLETERVGSVVGRFAAPAPESFLTAQRGWIDAAYSLDSIEDILARLSEFAADGNTAAAEAAVTISGKSPTALKVTLESLRRARTMGSLERSLEQEYRVGLRFLATPDFREGIRAQVIDKDRHPLWTPDTLEAVGRDTVAGYFAPLGARELNLDAADTRPPEHKGGPDHVRTN